MKDRVLPNARGRDRQSAENGPRQDAAQPRSAGRDTRGVPARPANPRASRIHQSPPYAFTSKAAAAIAFNACVLAAASACQPEPVREPSVATVQTASPVVALPPPEALQAPEPWPDDGSLRDLKDPELEPHTCPFPGVAPYPQKALTERVQGKVVARCVVEADGSLSGCKLLTSSPLFDNTVLSHLAKARVHPFTWRGQPARVLCTYPFRYRIQ